MKVTFLGTGTSHGVPMIGCRCDVCRSTDPRDSRLRPSILVEWDDGVRVLVDTSTDLRQQALRVGLDRVDAIVYTHSHADHVFGFDEVRRFNASARGPVTAFGDARTMADIRRTFAYAFGTDAPAGGGVPQVDTIEVDVTFNVRGHDIEPVPIDHGSRRILGYRFERFAYLTDCSAIPDTSWPLLTGLDVLVLGALRDRPHPTHFSLGEAVAAAARAGAGRTFFTHMCHDLGHAATNARLPAGVALAHDGLVLTL